MSQPLSNVLGVKRGIDSDKPDKTFEPEPPREPRGRVRRFTKKKRSAGIETIGENQGVEAVTPERNRALVALITILCGLISTLTGVWLVFGVGIALIVFGASTVVLGTLIGMV